MEVKFECFVCKNSFKTEEDIPELEEGEVLLCDKCAKVVHRLTGVK